MKVEINKEQTIRAIKAHAEGSPVYYRKAGSNDPWKVTVCPSWDFDRWEYNSIPESTRVLWGVILDGELIRVSESREKCLLLINRSSECHLIEFNGVVIESHKL
jgi:hypothetical protein